MARLTDVASEVSAVAPRSRARTPPTAPLAALSASCGRASSSSSTAGSPTAPGIGICLRARVLHRLRRETIPGVRENIERTAAKPVRSPARRGHRAWRRSSSRPWRTWSAALVRPRPRPRARAEDPQGLIYSQFAPLAQLDERLAEPGGRRFDSCRARQTLVRLRPPTTHSRGDPCPAPVRVAHSLSLVRFLSGLSPSHSFTLSPLTPSHPLTLSPSPSHPLTSHPLTLSLSSRLHGDEPCLPPRSAMVGRQLRPNDSDICGGLLRVV